MSKSVIYAANTSQQAVGTVNFGNVVRRYGCNCQLSGGNVVVDGAGYYDIDCNITVSSTAGGDAVATMYLNGAAIPGAVVTQTVAANGSAGITLPGMVRTYCCNPSTITVVISGITGNVENAAIVVEKE